MQNLSEFRSGPDYDAQYGALYNPEIKLLTAVASEQNAKIVDVCCGTGIVTIPLAEAGFEIYGIDVSPEMLAHAKTKATHLNKNGFFVFGTRLLEGYDISLDQNFEFWEEYKDASGNLIRFLGKKRRFDSKRNILYFDMKREYPDGKEISSAIEIKFMPYNDMLSLMERAGFELEDRYADWSMNPFDSKGSNGVFKLKKLWYHICQITKI